MNPTRITSSALSIGVLVAILSSQLVLSTPTYGKLDQLTGLAPNEDNEMAAAENELASLQEPANMADGEVDEGDDIGSSSSSSGSGSSGSNSNNQQRWADNGESYEPNGQDSNIENAKIHMAPMDTATAAGHHHYGHHGHYVSGKMSMGAHSGHKGAFGWHAKFPVGGKGRR